MARRLLRSALSCALLLFAAACGGGGGAGGALPAGGGGGTATAQTATVTFTLAIPGRTPGKKGRLPAYVSSRVSWATIQYTSGTGGGSGTINAGCTTNCAATFTAPVGVDRFDITLFDPNGNALSKGSTTSVVAAGGPNAISMTFNGIVHDATLHMVPASLPAGTAATALMFVDAHDADGATIIPDGTYVDANDNPVTFSIHDETANSPFSFNTNGVTAPGTVLPVQYDGAATFGTTFDLSTTSSLPGSVTGATLAVTPTTVQTYAFNAPGVYGHDIVTDGTNGYVYADDSPVRTTLGNPRRSLGGARSAQGVRRTMSPSSGTGGLFECCAGNAATELAPDSNVSDLGWSPANGGSLWSGGAGSSPLLQEPGGRAVTLPDSSEFVQRMAIGPDGTVYFTGDDQSGPGGAWVGFQPTGASPLTQLPIPTGTYPIGIAFGHDGNAWFAEWDGHRIGILNPGEAPSVTDIPLPTPYDVPFEVVEGPLHDGMFVLGYSNGDPTQWTLWKIPYATHVATVVMDHTALPPQACGCGFYRLRAGADQSLWTIDLNTGYLVRIALPGRKAVEFAAMPGSNPVIDDIAPMPDGSVLYVGSGVNGVGKLYW